MSINAQPLLLFDRWPFRQTAIGLFLAAFLFNTFGTWNTPLLYNDEARFSEASREMRERHDWVVPYFNNEFRFDKPPLVYWCQVPAMALLGENEFAARLHSVLAGAILAVVIFGFGTRVWNAEVGFWAAIIFITSLRAIMQMKAATADALLTLFVTLAFWAGWELLRAQPRSAWRSGWWWLFYVSLALAFLAKGPAGWMPLLALPVYYFWTKPAGLNRCFRLELGLPLMAGLLALWAVPAYLRTHGEFLRVGVGTHIVTRMTQGYEGHGAANIWMYLLESPFYFVLIFFSMMGWSIWFPWCFKKLRMENWGGDTERYLISGMLVTFCIFTLGWSRRPHYTLPVFPLIALLFAGLWVNAGRSQRLLGKVAVWIAIISLILTQATVWLVPKFVPGKELIVQCSPFLKPDSSFATVDLEQASLVWYFRQYVHDFRRLLTPDEAVGFMAQSGPRFCVMTREVAQEKFPMLPETWRRIDAKTSGMYSATNKSYFLTVLIKP